jgi:hypothetical protein
MILPKGHCFLRIVSSISETILIAIHLEKAYACNTMNHPLKLTCKNGFVVIHLIVLEISKDIAYLLD